MFDPDEYQLLDFGENEKLESFGGIVVRRETPSAFGDRELSSQWENAQLRLGQVGENLQWEGKPPADWQIRFQERAFLLRQTPTGQIGVFPEQATTWDWIAQCPYDLNGTKALNLFAYTGGTTLALADRGANVVHLDAAKSVIKWARLNAQYSAMEGASIRWIFEDALTFVQREIKRGNRYEIVIADPPSFGRGPNGETWKIQRDLPRLLEGIAELSEGRCKLFLISCHTPGFDAEKLKSLASIAFGRKKKLIESLELSIPASTGRRLPSGSCARWFQP
jgi:23S rRNA (cytosine1962-C5)-methyltransferase